MDNQINNFIGQGIIFPIELVNGATPLESGFELIRSSIITILTWRYGTRFFLGEFGSKLHLLLDEPNDQILQETIKAFVIDAITNWDSRIQLGDVVTVRDPSTSDTINMTVTYEILNTKLVDSFTFPFYSKIIY